MMIFGLQWKKAHSYTNCCANQFQIISQFTDCFNYKGLIMDNNQQELNAFLHKATSQSLFPECIRLSAKKYEINAPELIKTSPEEILRLRSIVLAKRNNEPSFRQKCESEWNECEKKIFNWIAVCYSAMHSKNLQNFNDKDMEYLSSITTGKSLPLVRYHLCTLRKESRPKWSEMEDKILYQILAVEKKFVTKGEWIHVSKQLFLRGDLTAYKSAKSCRERWFNYIDPALSKQWTTEEDRIVLQFVKKEGKKWAFMSNQLNHAKNEHMIKNRFYSLLKKEQKAIREELEQQELVDIILKRLKNQTSNSNMKMMQEYPKVKVQAKQKSVNFIKESDFQMKLISSIQFNPTHTKQPHDNHLSFIPSHGNQLDTSKFFKEQPEQKDARGSQLLKMSQSLAYNNLAYPSPVPVTPGSDLNLFSEHPSLESSGFKGNFKFNMHDFISKTTQ